MSHAKKTVRPGMSLAMDLAAMVKVQMRVQAAMDLQGGFM